MFIFLSRFLLLLLRPSFLLSFLTISSSPVMTAVPRKPIIVLWVQRDLGVGQGAFSHPRRRQSRPSVGSDRARASSCPAGPRVPLCSAGHCAVLARQSQGLWAPARFQPVTIWQGHRRRVAAHVCNHLADQPAQVAGRQVRGSTEQRKCEVIVQELCERRGGRHGLSVLTSLMVSVDMKQY